MPRNMSFMLTTEQIRNGTKTVTRRLGWKNLKPGTVINACVKCQGLGKGGKVEVIRPIRVVSVTTQALDFMLGRHLVGLVWSRHYFGQEMRREVAREGFPGQSPQWFVDHFCQAMKCSPDVEVTRIEFEYV